MKKTLNLIMALTLSLSFFSCTDKENDEPKNPVANEVAATYSGTMTATAMGTDLTFENVEVNLSVADDSHVNVAVGAFGNPPMQLPEITINDVAVSKTETGYALATTQFEGTSSEGKNYSGTLSGRYENCLELTMELHYGNMPMPMVCKYVAYK